MNEDLMKPKSVTIPVEIMKPGVNKNGSSYSLETVRQAVEQIREIADPFVGQPNTPETRSAVQLQISQELIDDGRYDVMGHLAQAAGRMAAKKLEEKLFADLQDSIFAATGVPKDMLGADTSAGGPLTAEQFDEAVSSITGMKISERLGAAVINSNGIAKAKLPEDPRLMDIVVMRQFTELGQPFSEEDLQDFAANAIDQRFDVDWLHGKYPDESLELFLNKDMVFVVESTDIDHHAYAHKKMEKAVYATGSIMPRTRPFSRGKRGMAGQAVLQAMGGFTVGELADIKMENVDVDPATGTMNVSVSATLKSPIEQISINLDLGKGETE